MICYRDMTFCSSNCSNNKCGRFFDDAEFERAVKWWGSDDVPIAFSDFSGGCKDYKTFDDEPTP